MTIDTTRLEPGELSQLLGSRLCHDLVSPLGAIGNGVELLEMSPDYPGIGDSAEMRLIAESVAAARNRIQVFRMAFGQAQSGQRVGRAELARLVEAIAAQSRLRIQFEAEGDFARSEARMVLLALMCIETGLPWGGRVMALHGPAGWRFVAEADRTKPDPALWCWLGGEIEGDCATRPPTPSEVHFALLAEAAMEAERKVTWEVDEKGAEITF